MLHLCLHLPCLPFHKCMSGLWSEKLLKLMLATPSLMCLNYSSSRLTHDSLNLNLLIFAPRRRVDNPLLSFELCRNGEIRGTKGSTKYKTVHGTTMMLSVRSTRAELCRHQTQQLCLSSVQIRNTAGCLNLNLPNFKL